MSKKICIRLVCVCVEGGIMSAISYFGGSIYEYSLLVDKL